MTKHITLGVAGHVDHGKTALVRALTGTETDRLKEEQERGMSIVLGFAHLSLPGGDVDFIDVPGHEKFVRTMISGATGIDAALLVIAANERVKPQTVEHLALMSLLGIRRGLVVVAKSDLVPNNDERNLVAAQVRAFLSGKFLHDAPLCFTSSITGEGLTDVRNALTGLLAETPAREGGPYFYLPVDRVFTLTGQGTIVTGTLRRGALRVGQSVELWPRGRQAEVRGLEVHGQAVEIARPGWRTAVNLRGVKKEEIARGDALATPGALHPTRLLDVELTLLSSAKPLKRGATVSLHFGTAEQSARVYPLGGNTLAPGETEYAQLRLPDDIVVPVGEPFILRALSPAETLGGGVIVDPYPQKHTQTSDTVQSQVQVLAHGSPVEKLAAKLLQAGPNGYELSSLSRDLGLTFIPADAPLVHCAGGLVLHREIFDALRSQLASHVGRFHVSYPLRRGMPQEELRRRLPRGLKPAAFARVLEMLTASGTLETVNGLVLQANYSPETALSPIERAIAREIEELFHCGGLRPPSLEEVLKKDRRRKTLYRYLIEAGILVPTTERTSNRTVTFHRNTIAEAASRLRASLISGKGHTVSELNALLGTTRKFSIPLLEYLDAAGVTQRRGDLRYAEMEGGDDDMADSTIRLTEMVSCAG